MAPKLKTLHVSSTGSMTPGPDVENPNPQAQAETEPPTPTAQPPATVDTPPPVQTPPAPASFTKPVNPFKKIFVDKAAWILDSVTGMEVDGVGVVVKTRYRQAPLDSKGRPHDEAGNLIPGVHTLTDSMVFIPGAALVPIGNDYYRVVSAAEKIDKTESKAATTGPDQ